jgi:hypothetical protein
VSEDFDMALRLQIKGYITQGLLLRQVQGRHFADGKSTPHRTVHLITTANILSLSRFTTNSHDGRSMHVVTTS